MNTGVIAEATRSMLAGGLNFPGLLGVLSEEGVEYYQADLVLQRIRFYGGTGEAVEIPVPYENLPSIAGELQVDLLRAALLDSRRNGQLYRDFLKRAMRAGVQGYSVFLKGDKTIYWGRCGETHHESFGEGDSDIPDIPLGA